MSAPTHIGKITICRTSSDEIHIEIEDRASGVYFFDGRMSVHDFGMMITGLSGLPVSFKLRRADAVGMRCVRESRECEWVGAGDDRYDMVAATAWLVANKQEDGWTIDAYLGSRDSMHHKDGRTFLRYAVVKYVPAEVSK